MQGKYRRSHTGTRLLVTQITNKEKDKKHLFRPAKFFRMFLQMRIRNYIQDSTVGTTTRVST